ncbi:MAG: hypothetical protein ABH863_00500 [Candidatus Micrarchaeota archaeon]
MEMPKIQNGLLAAAFAGFARIGIERRGPERRQSERRSSFLQIEKERRRKDRRRSQDRNIDLMNPFSENFSSRLRSHFSSRMPKPLMLPSIHPDPTKLMADLHGIAANTDFLASRLKQHGPDGIETAYREALANAYNAGVRLRGSHKRFGWGVNRAKPRYKPRQPDKKS